jgi:hypothetical protein
MLLIYPIVSSVGRFQDCAAFTDAGRRIGIRHGNAIEPLGRAAVL